MKINISILRLFFLVSILIGFAGASFSPIVDCNAVFSAQYAGQNLFNLTDYSGMANIVIMIILADFSIMSIAYALGSVLNVQNQSSIFGTPIQTNSLTTFAQTELLEGVFNVIILVAVGFGMLSVAPIVAFLVNLVQIGTPGATGLPIGTSSLTIYKNLCGFIGKNIVNEGFGNWVDLLKNLYVANFLQSVSILAIPNSFGYAYQPFGGISLLVQLLWDDQNAFFGTMFFGMFLIVLLFIIYFLFPIFLYVGIALRCFPWTRAAGGSFIALFIAFYIIFPSLMYPFVDGHPGPGVCSGGQASNPLCISPGFGNSVTSIFTFLGNGWNFGQVYYDDITAFVSGFFFVGLNIFGLVVALLISYELVEKLGSILGAPSINPARALSRIV